MPELIELPENHISQAYGIMLLENKHKLIRKLKTKFAPSIHGHKTWSSSYLMMDYLLHKRLLKRRMPVLEVGCGWGPLSIFCAKHQNCQVTGLDRDEEVFPYMEVQATLNGVEVNPMQCSFEKLSKKQLADYSMVLATDVCFWDSLIPIHFKLIKRAVKAGVKDIIYADPGRSTFLELAKQCSLHLDAKCVEWYSCEPDYFDGYVLHIRNH